MFFSDHILDFFQHLEIKTTLPESVEVLNPYKDKDVFELCRQFYKKYYNDNAERTLILGINPGRLGGGLTGIPFTDPLKLEKYCGIANSLQRKAELSADFIYQVITEYGGPESFYSKFYFSSVSPLGFTMNGKNLNYYDIRELETTLRTFVVESITKTLKFGINTSVCYCLGEGKNFKFLNRLNDEQKFFNEIIPLPHPRFIMQYRRKGLPQYIGEYLLKLRGTINHYH